MAHAYTPGLRVAELTVVRKERRLPLPGEVLVKVGDRVKATQVVARTELPGNVESVNVANRLGVPPEDVPQCMLKKEGDSIQKGEVIAQSKSFFGLFKSSCQATVTGTVETVSSVTGQVLLREPPLPVEVRAYVDGIVTEVLPREGVMVETPATFIQGIFGIGGEIQGELVMVAESPGDILDADRLTEAVRGKVAVGGSLVTAAAIHNRARQLGGELRRRNPGGVLTGSEFPESVQSLHHDTVCSAEIRVCDSVRFRSSWQGSGHAPFRGVESGLLQNRMESECAERSLSLPCACRWIHPDEEDDPSEVSARETPGGRM